MKFNKELDENAVPEWKEKYLDYKQGKKKLKAVGRAIRSVDRSPLKNVQKPSPSRTSLRDAPVYSFLRGSRRNGHGLLGNNKDAARSQIDVANSGWQEEGDLESAADAHPLPRQVDEHSPLHPSKSLGDDSKPRMTRYGSIIGSPPGSSTPILERQSLELPDPALDPARSKSDQQRRVTVPSLEAINGANPTDQTRKDPHALPPRPPATQLAHTGNAYQVQRPVDEPPSTRSNVRSLFRPHRVNSTPSDARKPPLVKRVLSIAGGVPTARTSGNDHDVALEAYRELDFRQAEFFHFLDRELQKIEDFYKDKEDEAMERLKVLHEQLHIMRNQRLEELETAERRKRKHPHSNGGIGEAAQDFDEEAWHAHLPGAEHLQHYRNSVVAQMDSALDKLGKVRQGQIGKTSKAMRELGTPPSIRVDPADRDYTRRAQASVTYRVAKRQLKTAFVEYYRALELLKSYALLNHTAFRKITKKCDKTIAEQPGKKYMLNNVDRAKFVNSQTVDGLMSAAEDYYARYFERGNRKMAISKLRAKGYRTMDYTASILRTGLLTGAGIALAIDALVHGVEQSYSPNLEIGTDASFLLQIYAGYFLLLLLMGLFCVACREFKRHKVNYVFIFELHARHHLDWRQLAEMPSLFMFYLGLVMDLNFNWVGLGSMYIYWPIVLIAGSVLTMVSPLPVYYHRSRKWFLESLWRVLFSGLYPVEFRDLFFGDIFCSATYTFGNIEMFFCLYDRGWKDPPQCNSSHSVLFGFFTTVPGIMRALQCIRRFAQTRNAFPHLANTGKYCCTILSYMALSLYRLHRRWELLAVFIAFSTINSVYCIIWDIIMDFSLGDLSAKWPFLRKQLLFGHVWWYYGIIVLDPILRFNWVFYVIFKDDVQHSTIVSFMVALSEVLRRGVWALFRVENEQCANNRHLLASRAPSVPYSPAPVQPTAESNQDSPMVQTLRRVGTTMTSSHVQDYVRRKPDSSTMDIPESEDEDE